MRHTILQAMTLAFLVTGWTPAFAFDFGSEEKKTFELHGEMSDLFIWRNDSDFDSTSPYYDEEGQSVGGAASFLKPQLTYRPADSVKLFYESELGLNIYSRNNPDQSFPAANDYVAFKHREFWASYQLDFLSLKAGYQRVRDPSDLFLSHWMGALSGEIDLMRLRASFMIGQLPDSTYEGLLLTDNNLMHDNVIGGFSLSWDAVMETLTFDGGAYFMVDERVPRRQLKLATPYLGVRLRLQETFEAELFGLLQTGTRAASGVGEIDQSILAWALSARAAVKTRWVDLQLSSFALSPDDSPHGNDSLGAFFYSGKNRSATMMLTEDELRDRYDNFDERFSSTWGSFFVGRAGLAVTDFSATGKIGDWFFPQVIVGAGFMMNPDNAAGNSYAGLETNVVLRIRVLKIVDLLAAGQLFLPGPAAASFVNSTDMTMTEQVHGFQLGTMVKF